MTINFTSIKEKLNALQQTDKNRYIFGSSQHNYKSFPISISEIEDFERKHKFQIPEQYRAFLVEVGYGAGPYYGIWSLKDTDKELSIMIEDYKKEENVVVNPANDFPFKREDIEFLKNSFSKSFPYEDRRNTYPIEGNITILHQGCQGYGTLVTKGEFAGTVWDLYCEGGYDGYWKPARPPVCLQASNNEKRIEKYELKHFPVRDTNIDFYEPITFLEWYENWLDDSLLAFKELNDFNTFRLFNRLKPF